MKKETMYCKLLRPCGHKVERITEGLVLGPLKWWCHKCKVSMTDAEVGSKAPSRP